MKRNKIGFIKPNYDHEKRVALLPEDIDITVNDFILEYGFGSTMDIDDWEYVKKGCQITTREEIFKTCDIIFSLKLIQPSDYNYLREGQIIVGWTHPLGSGRDFMLNQAIPKKLIIVDLDNIYPKIYYMDKEYLINQIPKNFIHKNSIIAGYASTVHALTCFGLKPNSSTKVAILSSGNVAQGAFQAMSNYGSDIHMFYRKTMDEFIDNISSFDIIINGIEISKGDDHIINKEQVSKIKRNALVIDAAADAGNAIYGTRFTSHDNPIIKLNEFYYYCVNNSPTIYYRTASKYISESFSKHVYNIDFSILYDYIKD